MKLNILYSLFLCSSWALLLSVEAIDSNMSYSDMAQTLENIGGSCKPPPTKENIREILLSVKEASRETQCFRRCLMEIFDLHVPDSTQMREEIALEFGGMIYPERKEEFGALLKTCNARNAAIQDNCASAHAHFMCILEELQSNGFDILEIKEE